MTRMAVRDIAQITNGRMIHNGADVVVDGFSTDSRTLQAGELFIPLRGENYDGHAFLSQAMQHGAAACLSEEVVGGLPIPVVQVKDTLRALGDLAAWVRRQYTGKVVGITGSSGKTTCKEMLASILAQTGPGHKSAGNFNNLIGVPLTLFDLGLEHNWAVIEMGMSSRGEIARLVELAAPQIGIITNVAAAHLETLGGISGVARAKGELFAHLPLEGTAVINADDPEVRQLPVANGVAKIYFGLSPTADVRGEQIEVVNGSVDFTLCIAEQRHVVKLPLPGRHNVSNALAAAAAAYVLDVDIDLIAAGLASFRPCPGRMELIELPDDIVILEDSYNANPLSVRAALDALHDLGRPGRRIAVLGDMLELGEAADELHQEVGAVAAERVDWLLTYGPLAKEVVAGAVTAGLDAQKVYSSTSHEELADRLKGILKPGDRVLIKGSRGMRMENVTALLRDARLGLAVNGS